MRHVARLIAVLFITLSGALAAEAVETPYIVVDAASGRVLSSRNPFQDWYPASITKLMNAYVVFKALRAGEVTKDSHVVVTKNALAEPPSKMGFKVGTVIDLNNALTMMLVHSSNDIAMAVAESVGGSEEAFVARMNAEAARLGMTSTHFINPNGLPGAGQYTTARDLAVLARALWTEFPEWRPIFRIPAIQSGNRVLKSANNLLERYPGTVGMKTGFICSSGFNIVAAAEKNGRTLIAVVLGMQNAKDRAELAARLLNDGFEKPASGNTMLAGYRGNSPVAGAIDMKPAICMRKARGEHEDEDAADVSYLVPKFQLMPPVIVTTLGMMAADGSIRAVNAADLTADAPPVATKKKGKTASKSTTSKQTTTVKEAAGDETPAAAPAKKPARKVKKPVVPDANGTAAADATATGDAAVVDAPAAPVKKATKAMKTPAKLEVGVPFDSTDIAPLPDPASPAQ